MTKITCEICQDLIPLVQDGIASADSEAAVREHLKYCEECKRLYDGEIPPESDAEKIYRSIQKKMRGFFSMILMMGIFIGLSITEGADVFYNILLMPVIGAIGYYLFRWRAKYKIPVFLFIIFFALNVLGLAWGGEVMDIFTILMYSLIYVAFVLVGIIIAGLLHFAFRKED